MRAGVSVSDASGGVEWRPVEEESKAAERSCQHSKGPRQAAVRVSLRPVSHLVAQYRADLVFRKLRDESVEAAGSETQEAQAE